MNKPIKPIEQICWDCAKTLCHGGRPNDYHTMTMGKCDACGEVKAVTTPNDYGGLKSGKTYRGMWD